MPGVGVRSVGSYLLDELEVALHPLNAPALRLGPSLLMRLKPFAGGRLAQEVAL